MVLLFQMFTSYLKLVRLNRGGVYDTCEVPHNGNLKLSHQQTGEVEKNSEENIEKGRIEKKKQGGLGGCTKLLSLIQDKEEDEENNVSKEYMKEEEEAPKDRTVKDRTNEEKVMLTTLLVDMMRRAGKKVCRTIPTSISNRRNHTMECTPSRSNLIIESESDRIDDFHTEGGIAKQSGRIMESRAKVDSTSTSTSTSQNNIERNIEVDIEKIGGCDTMDHEERGQDLIAWRDLYNQADLKHFQTVSVLDILENLRAF